MVYLQFWTLCEFPALSQSLWDGETNKISILGFSTYIFPLIQHEQWHGLYLSWEVACGGRKHVCGRTFGTWEMNWHPLPLAMHTAKLHNDCGLNSVDIIYFI